MARFEGIQIMRGSKRLCAGEGGNSRQKLTSVLGESFGDLSAIEICPVPGQRLICYDEMSCREQ
jgi:hypothetical protein